jgi:hypothetical protein
MQKTVLGLPSAIKPWLCGRAACAIALAAVSAAIYARVLGFGYVWDDTEFFRIQLPAWIQANGWNLAWLGGKSQFLQGGISYFRPLALLGFYGDARLSGFNPAFSHGINLAIFIANALLVFSLAEKLQESAGKSNASWPALLAALAYAAHPALVEPAAWISGRFDLLATCFILLAARLQLSRQKSWAKLPGIALCFLCAALSKETGIMLPAALFCLWLAGQGHPKESGKALLALAIQENRGIWLACLLAAGTYCLLRIALDAGFALPGGSGAAWLPAADGTFLAAWGKRLFSFVEALKFYLCQAIFPFASASALHPANEILPWTTRDILGNLASLLFLCGVSYRAFFRRSASAWLFLAGFALLLPALHLLPLSIGGNLTADRFLAAPLAFWCLALTAFPYGKIRGSRAFAVLQARMPNCPLAGIAGLFACGWIALAALASFGAVPAWKSDLTLWQAVVAQHPQNAFAARQYLTALANAGEWAALGQETARLQKNLSGPDKPYAQFLLCDALLRQGENQSLACFQALATQNPALQFAAKKSISHAQLPFAEVAQAIYADYSQAVFRFGKDPQKALQLLETAEWCKAHSAGLPALAFPLPALQAAYRIAAGDYDAGTALLRQSANSPAGLAQFALLLTSYCETPDAPRCADMAKHGIVVHFPKVPPHAAARP